MPDSPAIKSALGHIEWLTECVATQQGRIDSGEHPLNEAETRSLMAYYEGRLKEWKATLERARKEEAYASPLA